MPLADETAGKNMSKRCVTTSSRCNSDSTTALRSLAVNCCRFKLQTEEIQATVKILYVQVYFQHRLSGADIALVRTSCVVHGCDNILSKEGAGILAVVRQWCLTWSVVLDGSVSGEDGVGAPRAPADMFPRSNTDLCDRCRIFLCSIFRFTSCDGDCMRLVTIASRRVALDV